MTITFPTNPTNGQIYNPPGSKLPTFRWKSSTLTWEIISSGAVASTNIVIFADTQPTARSDNSSLVAGDFWFDNTTSMFFIYYSDADSGQWLQLNSSSPLASENLSSDSSILLNNPDLIRLILALY